jgi:putative toxin-antitoxin system antitoxin component (TIGR02293 family)
MGTPHHPTEAEQLSDALAHPSPGSIWARALETFGDEAKARHWMNAPRDIFEGRSPQQLIETDNPAEQRRVLTVLIRIDYGVFS